MKNFVAGMNKDVDLPNQPEGSYRDALNMNLKYSTGSVVTEGGTYRIPAMTGKQVVGSVTLDNDHIIFFTIFKHCCSIISVKIKHCCMSGTFYSIYM